MSLLHPIGEHVITDVLRFVPDLAFSFIQMFSRERTTAILRRSFPTTELN